MNEVKVDLQWLELGLAEHEGLCWRICSRITGNPNDAADAYQEACLTLIRRSAEFRAGTSLRAWICAYMRRASINFVDKRSRIISLREKTVAANKEKGMSDSPLDKTVLDEQALLVRKVLSALSTGDREALELRYFEDLSDAEVAVVLGVKPKAANKRIVRALEKMRKAFGRGVTLALLLSLLSEIGEAEAGECNLPANLREWKQCAFAQPPVKIMTGGDFYKERVVTMIKNPVAIAATIMVCCLAIWITGTNNSNSDESSKTASKEDHDETKVPVNLDEPEKTKAKEDNYETTASVILGEPGKPEKVALVRLTYPIKTEGISIIIADDIPEYAAQKEMYRRHWADFIVSSLKLDEETRDNLEKLFASMENDFRGWRKASFAEIRQKIGRKKFNEAMEHDRINGKFPDEFQKLLHESWLIFKNKCRTQIAKAVDNGNRVDEIHNWVFEYGIIFGNWRCESRTIGGVKFGVVNYSYASLPMDGNKDSTDIF